MQNYFAEFCKRKLGFCKEKFCMARRNFGYCKSLRQIIWIEWCNSLWAPPSLTFVREKRERNSSACARMRMNLKKANSWEVSGRRDVAAEVLWAQHGLRSIGFGSFILLRKKFGVRWTEACFVPPRSFLYEKIHSWARSDSTYPLLYPNDIPITPSNNPITIATNASVFFPQVFSSVTQQMPNNKIAVPITWSNNAPPIER